MTPQFVDAFNKLESLLCVIGMKSFTHKQTSNDTKKSTPRKTRGACIT